MKTVIIGGGAAGIFAAISAKYHHPDSTVIVLEKSAKLLSKVRISGGGRCNVTHHCFDPRELVKNYPRGHRELLGPFHRFQPADTVNWFESRGVELKVEEDGRMFPTTDSSQTIIDCLLGEANALGVEIRMRQRIESVERLEGKFSISISGDQSVECDKVVLATGSAPQGHLFAQDLGHILQPSVPSLFTFNVPDFKLIDLAGVSVEPAVVSLPGNSLSQRGPLLITHWGFSGPAALKLSAWGARTLHEKEYNVLLRIDWLPELSEEKVKEAIVESKQSTGATSMGNLRLFPIPKKLWKQQLELSGIDPTLKLSSLSKSAMNTLLRKLKSDDYQVKGKTNNKEEFVTCGGVTLKEVDFKTMESKRCPGLFFAGEVLDIDGVTGGFNFQNAWTTGFIAGQ